MVTESRIGLSGKFEKFRKKIEPTDNQKRQIISTHTHLRESYLINLPYVSKTFLTGSYKRNTMIRPLNDVDVFIVIDESEYDITPNSVLNKLKRDLSGLYPNTDITRDRPCITLDFNHCRFELTPAIPKESFFFLGDDYFFIPGNGGNHWVKVEDPKDLESDLSNANRRLDGRLTPLIKMMKAWARFNNIIDIKSFELEKKAINSLYEIENYRDGVEKLLKIFGWEDAQGLFSSKIGVMDDSEFARYCRNELFGNDFPV